VKRIHSHFQNLIHIRDYNGIARMVDQHLKKKSWREMCDIFERQTRAYGAMPGRLRDAVFHVLDLDDLVGLDVSPWWHFRNLEGHSVQELREEVKPVALESLRVQVSKWNTFFLDTESLAGTPYSMILPDIIKARDEELRSLGTRPRIDRFFNTYYGFELAAAGTIGIESREGMDHDVARRIEETMSRLGIEIELPTQLVRIKLRHRSNLSTVLTKLISHGIRMFTYAHSAQLKSIRIIGQIGDSRAVQLLHLKLNRSIDTRVQKAVIDSLGRIGAPDSLEILSGFLGKKYLSNSAVRAIGLVRDAAALRRIIEIATSGAIKSKRVAVDALGNRASKDAINALIRLFPIAHESLKNEILRALSRVISHAYKPRVSSRRLKLIAASTRDAISANPRQSHRLFGSLSEIGKLIPEIVGFKEYIDSAILAFEENQDLRIIASVMPKLSEPERIQDISDKITEILRQAKTLSILHQHSLKIVGAIDLSEYQNVKTAIRDRTIELSEELSTLSSSEFKTLGRILSRFPEFFDDDRFLDAFATRFRAGKILDSEWLLEYSSVRTHPKIIASLVLGIKKTSRTSQVAARMIRSVLRYEDLVRNQNVRESLNVAMRQSSNLKTLVWDIGQYSFLYEDGIRQPLAGLINESDNGIDVLQAIVATPDMKDPVVRVRVLSENLEGMLDEIQSIECFYWVLEFVQIYPDLMNVSGTEFGNKLCRTVVERLDTPSDTSFWSNPDYPVIRVAYKITKSVIPEICSEVRDALLKYSDELRYLGAKGFR
jgi:hypothetical protein